MGSNVSVVYREESFGLGEAAKWVHLGTNISSSTGTFESMIFLFPRWDMLVPWRVIHLGSCRMARALCWSMRVSWLTVASAAPIGSLTCGAPKKTARSPGLSCSTGHLRDRCSMAKWKAGTLYLSDSKAMMVHMEAVHLLSDLGYQETRNPDLVLVSDRAEKHHPRGQREWDLSLGISVSRKPFGMCGSHQDIRHFSRF